MTSQELDITGLKETVPNYHVSSNLKSDCLKTYPQPRFSSSPWQNKVRKDRPLPTLNLTKVHYGDIIDTSGRDTGIIPLTRDP